MNTYYKATRPDANSFYDGSTKWRVGRITRLDGSAGSELCAAGLLHAATDPGESLVGGSWPCRLFAVERRARLVTSPAGASSAEGTMKQPPGTPPSTIEFFEVDAEGRRLYLTCWDCGHSVNREHPCHHCGSKLVRQGGHSLQPFCGCRMGAARL